MEKPQDESIDAIEADNARWDALLTTDESQALLERLADEALAELRAGRTRPMAFTDDGRPVPGEAGEWNSPADSTKRPQPLGTVSPRP